MSIKKVQVFFVFFVLIQCFQIRAQDLTNYDLFEGKRILITGGTGFLGKAIASEVLKYNPREVVLFSRDEVKHFNALNFLGNNSKIKSVIGDIRDYNYLLENTKNIDIVFHAAALKRIDMLEDNVEESVKTNILGTLNIFHACSVNKIKKVVFISTDKACSPVNAYGASKFISEKIFTNYDKKNVSTAFMVVRFGNILESTGSIIPIFAEKIKKGETITLTDERMTRFIASKQEAVELIFDVLRYGIGGEIFVRKLPSLRIPDLIDVLKNKFKSQSNLIVTGIRPGEKIHEELINFAEVSRTFDFGNYYVITPSVKEWLYGIEVLPLYLNNDKRLNENIMKGFSSDGALVSKEEIVGIFEKFEVLAEKTWK